MAEGATPAERTTGGKEAPGIPGVRQAAVARIASNSGSAAGVKGGGYALSRPARPKEYTRNFSHSRGRSNLRAPRNEIETKQGYYAHPPSRPAVNYNNVGPGRMVTT